VIDKGRSRWVIPSTANTTARFALDIFSAADTRLGGNLSRQFIGRQPRLKDGQLLPGECLTIYGGNTSLDEFAGVCADGGLIKQSVDIQ
jgi:hypothetical protein